MLASILVATSHARPPAIATVNLRGLQIGATTKLTIDGADLLPSPRLALDTKFVEAAVDPASTPSRVILSVPIDAATHPGLGALRIVTAEGFSNSVPVGLDFFQQLPLAETVPALPATLHGAVPGSFTSKTTFAGKAGQELMAEVTARRLGSRLRPVIHIYDARRTEVAWAMPSVILDGDARCRCKLPQDGTYTVEIHDAQYAPPGPSFFLLRLGQWKFEDQSYPAAVNRLDARPTVQGNLTGLPGILLGSVIDRDVLPFSLPANGEWAGVPPTIRVSEQLELTDQIGPPSLNSFPVGVTGRLVAPNERDRYRVAAQPGKTLRLEVFAERIGSPIDAVLEIRNLQNGLLAQSDDTPTSTDPKLDFAFPASGLEAVEVVVRDNLERGGQDSLYRLVVAEDPIPDLVPATKSDTLNVAAGETAVLELHVDRQACEGPLKVEFAELPNGFAIQGNEIPAGANGALLAVTNGGDSPAQVLTSLRVKANTGFLVRRARMEPVADDRTPVWLRETFALASAPRNAVPFQVAWANPEALPSLRLASKTAIPLKIVRPASTFGPVRLSLVTSQPVPKINNQPNLILAVRLEQPNLEIPVAPPVKAAGDALAALEKQLADATTQAKAGQGDAKVAADAKVADLTQKKTAAEAVLKDAEAKAVYDANVSLVVPSQWSEPSADIALRAELLTPERNAVVRTTYTPVRRLPVVNPLSIKLASSTIESPFDAKTGAMLKIEGTIERLAPYQGPVTVTITGLPPGIGVPNAAVKMEDAAFVLPLNLPANFAGDLPPLKLAATGPPDPLTGNLPVKTEADLTIKLKR